MDFYAVLDEIRDLLQRRGRVTYIAPDVRPETRTTQLRIEVRNDDTTLRFSEGFVRFVWSWKASYVSLADAKMRT